jgi:hypothetical protein
LLPPFVAEFAGSHIVDGGFQQTGIAIAVPKGHPEALAYVTKFIEDAKASGGVLPSVSYFAQIPDGQTRKRIMIGTPSQRFGLQFKLIRDPPGETYPCSAFVNACSTLLLAPR